METRIQARHLDLTSDHAVHDREACWTPIGRPIWRKVDPDITHRSSQATVVAEHFLTWLVSRTIGGG